MKDEDGRPVRFGSVGGGGRYDGLVGRFMKDNVPATGFSIGVSRLQAALAALGRAPAAQRRRPGRGHHHGPRPVRRLSGARHQTPRRRHISRTLSRRFRHEGAVEIRRPPQRPGRDHPGVGRKGAAASSRSRTSPPARRSPERSSTTPATARSAPARSKSPRPTSSPRSKRSSGADDGDIARSDLAQLDDAHPTVSAHPLQGRALACWKGRSASPLVEEGVSASVSQVAEAAETPEAGRESGRPAGGSCAVLVTRSRTASAKAKSERSALDGVRALWPFLTGLSRLDPPRVGLPSDQRPSVANGSMRPLRMGGRSRDRLSDPGGRGRSSAASPPHLSLQGPSNDRIL